MLQQVLDRATGRSFTPNYYDLDVLAENAHYKLFRDTCQEGHCFSHLCTEKPRPPGTMRLKSRGHKYQFPAIKYEFSTRPVILSCVLFLITV